MSRFGLVPTAALLLMIGGFFSAPALGGENPHGLHSTGQTVYVPIYSHIYSGDKEHPFYLAATLSIRNTDPGRSLTLTRVDYYDSDGGLLKRYLDTPLALGPLSSTRYVIGERDKAGGSGANFIVSWTAVQPVTVPIIESVMIGTQTQQGISFTSRGQVIAERAD